MLIAKLRLIRQSMRDNRMTDIPKWKQKIVRQATPFTMGTQARIISTIESVEYLVRNNIIGDIVECGVWRGGQMMAAALTLIALGEKRDIFLYDTFSGMTEPGKLDVDHLGDDAKKDYEASIKNPIGKRWCEASIDDVRKNIESTQYDLSRVHFIAGDVLETIPNTLPASISYLRLDTDWYQSTAHELMHLFPLVTPLGVVTIDDYGHWEGARRATDEFISNHALRVLLNRIDYSARQFIKV